MSEIKCVACEPDMLNNPEEDCQGCYVNELLERVDALRKQNKKLTETNKGLVKVEKYLSKKLNDDNRVWYALLMGDTVDLPKRLQKQADRISESL